MDIVPRDDLKEEDFGLGFARGGVIPEGSFYYPPPSMPPIATSAGNDGPLFHHDGHTCSTSDRPIHHVSAATTAAPSLWHAASSSPARRLSIFFKHSQVSMM
uniref:Uncharacterized protein n=1 Tax=Picea sitchensis TaxID=3332 RepID=A9NPA0_PICSI|nr:unknown [Picea sitchensis]